MRVIEAALAALHSGRRAALCTVVEVRGSTPRSGSSRMAVIEGGELAGSIGGGEVERRVIELAREAMEHARPALFRAHLTRDLGMCCGGEMAVFVEPLLPRNRLHIFGAGHVARALAPIAISLDFDVLVHDDREELNTAERFPGARRITGDTLRSLPRLGPSDYALIVTHSHQLDQQILQALLDQDFAWLGMIGSRAKVARFFVRLRAAGVDQALFRKVSAPVGLDIGAETPAEIAVAVAGELVRVRRGRRDPPVPLSEHPLAARGGDGMAVPPAWGPKAPTR